MMKIFILLLALSFASACGGGHNPDKEKLTTAVPLGNSSYYDLGQGLGLMSSVAPAVSSGANYEVGFSLQDGGSFTLVVFSDAQLLKGLRIQFFRSGNTLQVQASADGVIQDWSPQFTTIDASEVMTFNVDIHNNEKPAHILLWAGSKNMNQDHTNTLYNSAEDSVDLDYDAGPGNGKGRQWGFILNNSSITKAQLSESADSH